MLNEESIWRITLLTNPDKCNLSCPLCFLRQRNVPFGLGEMPFEIARSAILENGNNLKEIIPSTMGEPLLYSYFDELLELCSEKKIRMNLTTNGSFPNYKSFDKLSFLLENCSDIKISVMGFSENQIQELMPGLSFKEWKSNVETLSRIRNELIKEKKSVSTLSLQVTLNALNLNLIQEIIEFASIHKINRIKWNWPVFLSLCSKDLFLKYGISTEHKAELQNTILKFSQEKSVIAEGSLFFKSSELKSKETCRFKGELWVYPDGSKSNCPNPERRFGNQESKEANCSFCPMK